MIEVVKRTWKGFVRFSLVLIIVSVSFGAVSSTIAFIKGASAADNKPNEDIIIEDSISTSSGRDIIDQRADSLLKEMSYFLGSKLNYTFKAEIMFDNILSSGRKVQYSAEEKVFVQKPNKVYIEYISDLGGKKFWYDGNNLTLLDPISGLYSKVKVPNSIDQAFDEIWDEYEYSPPFSELLFVNPYKAMTENVKAGIYVGSSKVFGVQCQHLAFIENNLDWQIWIEEGQRKIPRKMVITYKTIPGSPQLIAILKDWIFDQSFSKFVFTPKLPKYARETDMVNLTKKSTKDLGDLGGSGGDF
ncbi:DUF2092 domain-containing protein [Desulfobacterota bacterium AH_259_B03_O07]|nr:DUF2092 domain-containing protein [Desulfobacterota bacterium AH_259_B03_O07]